MITPVLLRHSTLRKRDRERGEALREMCRLCVVDFCLCLCVCVCMCVCVCVYVYVYVCVCVCVCSLYEHAIAYRHICQSVASRQRGSHVVTGIDSEGSPWSEIMQEEK